MGMVLALYASATLASTNVYHLNRRFEPCLPVAGVPTTYKVITAISNLTDIVQAKTNVIFDTNNTCAVEYESVALGYDGSEAAWAAVLDDYESDWVTHSNKLYDNVGWVKGVGPVGDTWAAHLWLLQNHAAFRTSPTNFWVSPAGKTNLIEKVLVGTIGDYGPMQDVVDVGPTNWGEDTPPNFFGSDASADVSLHADFTAYYKLLDVKVELTNIKFNHDTGSSASDAINIRKDYNTPFTISNGEWVAKGGTNIPVCYTTNKAVTIKARFSVQPASITSAVIWAVSTDFGGSLGDVIKTNVTFTGGVSTPEYVTFQVSGTTPNCIQKTANDVWQWKIENVNGTGSPPWDLNTSGVHTVYTILSEPVLPWVNTAGDRRNAWKTALDLVCASAPWAGGETSVTGAASHITEAINGSGRFRYDIFKGEAKYLVSGTIELSKCIDRLNGGTGAGELVNCTDCANFITAFANLIGGELYSSRMYTLGAGFDTNPYTAIGRPAWTKPVGIPAGSWGWGFNFHEVGWTGSCGDGDSIFDPCLKVDGNGDPSTAPRTELLPVGMPFSDGNQGAPYVYRESLAAPGANGYGRCVAQPASKKRRPIK